jgi:hypothetical protein
MLKIMMYLDDEEILVYLQYFYKIIAGWYSQKNPVQEIICKVACSL